MTTAAAITDEQAVAWQPEPGWSRADFETLNEDEATAILLRRMRKLLARGLEPLDALRLASKLDAPLF
jgi:hypothetical protein